MKKIAQFFKVSYEEFEKGIKDTFQDMTKFQLMQMLIITVLYFVIPKIKLL